MNILSFLATVTAVLFVVVLFRRLTTVKLEAMNIFTILVCGTLGWWAFCDAFFYSAPTKEAAWFWHQIGAIGWCGFIGVTAYFFMLMAGTNKRMPFWGKTLYWVISGVLVIRFMSKRPTAFASDLVQSSSGLDWTYVTNFDSVWTYLFLLYLFFYLGGALVYLLWWQRKHAEENTQRLAVGFVVLDVSVISLGLVSIFVIPYFTDFLPPMSFIATGIFLAGYRYMLWEYDLQNIELAVNPRDVLENSMEAMIITDTHFQIVYANTSALALLKENLPEGKSLKNFFQRESLDIVMELLHDEILHMKNLSLSLIDGTPVIASGNRVSTRKGRVTLLVFSLHDISQLQQAQNQMEYMAHYDELTGLANRRRFGEILDVWEEKASEEGFDFALLFTDLNHFKDINDHYGHASGDEALITVAAAIRRALHAGDVAARLSGDEFVILHRMTESDTADYLMKYWRDTIRQADTSSFAPEIRLDAAVGLCLRSEAAGVRQQLKAADQRMYAMKQMSGSR